MKKIILILLIAASCVNAQSLLLFGDDNEGEWYESYTPFVASVNTTNNPTITFQGSVGDSMYVDWGDGQTETVVFTGSDQNITNTYSSAIDTEIKFYGNMTKFSTSSDMGWSFDLSDLPSGLTYYYNYGSNTTSF